jgi:hypothetical protein
MILKKVNDYKQKDLTTSSSCMYALLQAYALNQNNQLMQFHHHLKHNGQEISSACILTKDWCFSGSSKQDGLAPNLRYSQSKIVSSNILSLPKTSKFHLLLNDCAFPGKPHFIVREENTEYFMSKFRFIYSIKNKKRDKKHKFKTKKQCRKLQHM